MKPRIVRTCEACGAQFERLACQLRRGRGRFCSERCSFATINGGSFAGVRTRRQRFCEICRREFYGSLSAISRGHARFCSRACTNVFLRTFTGPKSCHWKGGAAKIGHHSRLLRATVAGGVTWKDWAQIKAKFGHQCPWCHTPGTVRRLTKDHIVPLALGGTHQPSNIQPLCLRCNQKKHLRILAFNPDGSGIEVTDMRAFIQSIVDGQTPLEATRINPGFLTETV